MKKYMVCMLTIFAFFMTIPLGSVLANYTSNEEYALETRWHWNMKVWRVQQSVADYDHVRHMDTSVYGATQQKSMAHGMNTTAKFESRYEYSKVKGTWYLRARLSADWATDEEPYEKNGKINGKKGGMKKEGKQSDTDWFADYDPLHTITLVDSYARARIFLPVRKVWYRTSSYSHFTTTDITYVSKKP